MPKIISEHMVLQRDTEVPIWGWADPGGFFDQEKPTSASEGGKGASESISAQWGLVFRNQYHRPLKTDGWRDKRICCRLGNGTGLKLPVNVNAD